MNTYTIHIMVVRAHFSNEYNISANRIGFRWSDLVKNFPRPRALITESTGDEYPTLTRLRSRQRRGTQPNVTPFDMRSVPKPAHSMGIPVRITRDGKTRTQVGFIHFVFDFKVHIQFWVYIGLQRKPSTNITKNRINNIFPIEFSMYIINSIL